MVSKFDSALTSKLNRHCGKKSEIASVWSETFPKMKAYGPEHHITLNLIKRKYGVGTELPLESKRTVIDSNSATCSKKIKFDN